MTLVLDDRRFIPFGLLLVALSSMIIIVVGRLQLSLDQHQLVAERRFP
jgi:hypothetical protein